MAGRIEYYGNDTTVAANLNRYITIYFEVLTYLEAPDGSWLQYTDRIDAVPCTADRFVNLTDQVSQLGIASDSNRAYCPAYLNTTLHGQGVSQTSTQLILNYDYCDQDQLNRMGINQTCATKDESDAVTSMCDAMIFFYGETFNSNKMKGLPINRQIKAQYYNLKGGQSVGQDLYLQRTNVTTQDNWFTSYFGQKDYQLYDVTRGNVYVGGYKA